jgi:predicted RNA-binding protein with RPS1 domain
MSYPPRRDFNNSSRPPNNNYGNSSNNNGSYNNNYGGNNNNNYGGNNNNYGGSNNYSQSVVAKKKKPKHLKRKLAAADGPDREGLLRELKAFEQAKASGELQPVTKKPRVAEYRNEHRPKVETQSPVKEQKSFPREEKKAEVIKSRPASAPKAVDPLSAKKEVSEPTPIRKLPIESKPSLTAKKEDSLDDGPTKQEASEPKSIQKSPVESKPPVGSKPPVKSKPSPKAKKEESSDDSDSDSDDSDSADEPIRKRGKRRRGRKDTSKEILEKAPEEPASAPVAADEPISEAENPKDDANAPDPSKKTMKRDDSRYCVGRIPVSDFSVGQKYDGTVVYVKPFGIFLDIGCHSDAFCHVSRLADDFVESPDALFKPGDKISSRVVEIDRRQKRITVSLQSDAKVDDERASVEAHAKRKERRRGPRKAYEESEPSPKKESPSPAAKVETNRPEKQPSPAIRVKPEAEMDPAELKRARKLARRAARRADSEGQANE